MRKLIFGINITADGCCDHTKGKGGADVHEYFAEQLRQAGALVYGRKTYELMVPFWPDIAKNQSGDNDTMNSFAKAFDSVGQIIVFSRTLGKIDDGKTTVISSGLEEAIRKLKQEDGKDLLLGGVDVPGQLMALDLIDEYRLMVQPYMAGAGRRLFDTVNMPDGLKLKLVETKAFASGNIALHYVRDRTGEVV